VNIDKIKRELQNIPIFNGDIIINSIEGGMTNDTFLVTYNNIDYVAKLGGKKYYGVIYSHEVEANNAAYKIGISPKLIYNDKKFLIFEYIKSKTLEPEDINNKQMLRKIVSLIKLIHFDLEKKLENKNLCINIFQIIKHRILLLQKNNSAHAPILKSLISDYKFFEKNSQHHKQVFSHNDFYCKNILQKENKILIIDWEYSGYNSCFLDLANLSKNNDLNEEREKFILNEYFGESFKPIYIKEFQIMKCVSMLNELLWSFISEIFAQKDFDYTSYTDRMLRRYKKQLEYFYNLWEI